MTKKVIVADDDENWRDIYVSLISSISSGAEIETVNDGNPLVKRVRKGGYSLVLTDNQMRMMDELEAIRQIRQYDRDVPIYIISGLDIEREALQVGATGYLSKSDKLRKKLQLVLKQHLG